MGCTHPFGFHMLRDEAGELVGIRCKACGMASYKGESFWAALRRNLPLWFGRRP